MTVTSSSCSFPPPPCVKKVDRRKPARKQYRCRGLVGTLVLFYSNWPQSWQFNNLPSFPMTHSRRWCIRTFPSSYTMMNGILTDCRHIPGVHFFITEVVFILFNYKLTRGITTGINSSPRCCSVSMYIWHRRAVHFVASITKLKKDTFIFLLEFKRT